MIGEHDILDFLRWINPRAEHYFVLSPENDPRQDWACGFVDKLHAPVHAMFHRAPTAAKLLKQLRDNGDSSWEKGRKRKPPERG